MSRGGFRGRGRGGPPGMPAFNSRDYMEAMAKANKHGGMLYPPLESKQLAYLTEPSDRESNAMSYAQEMEDIMSRGYGDLGTPWRLAAERKTVGIEIESYSDRFKPQASTSSTKLDPAVLHLDKSLFPAVLWKEYFEGPTATGGGAGGKRDKGKKRKRLDDEDIDAKLEEVSEEESVVDDFDFDDDEGSDHQDYDANYFDNGEGDDDSGGEEEEGNNGGGGDD